MADEKEPQQKPTIEDHVTVRAEQAAAWLTQDLFQKHGNKLLGVLVLILVAVFGIYQWRQSSQAAAVSESEGLGRGMDYLYVGRLDSAKVVLDSLMSTHPSGQVMGKAALLSANIRYRMGEWDSAAALFAIARDNASGADLLRSAADHGLAACAIEKGDYAGAARQLEGFVDRYGKRNGNLEERYQKKEPADLAPTVPDALLKLALCYRELGQPDKAKAMADRILKVYGESREATSAKKLLAAI